MIGVFDSGAGGLTALSELRKIAPDVNICFLADRKNAPYGTKTRERVIALVKENVKRLSSFGAERILMACCTASAVYPFLEASEKQICIPIIAPAARRATQISKTKRIGVIATERTVAEGAFTREITALCNEARVFELATQPLVAMIEGGLRDCNITTKEIAALRDTLAPLADKNIDTLILGCTHFPHVKRTIEGILGIKTVNPSFEGAKEAAKASRLTEDGRTVYL